MRAAVVHAIDIAVAILGDTGDAHEELVFDQREIARRAHVDAVEGTVGERHVAAVAFGLAARTA